MTSYLKKSSIQGGSTSPLNTNGEAVPPRDSISRNSSDPELEKPQTPQVESAVIRLASLTSSLHSSLDRLHERLMPALRTNPVCAGDENSPEGDVPLVNDLNDLGDRIEKFIVHVRLMESLLEL